ncbi:MULTISPECIES: DnaD domain protein [unclassified Mycoplasma]|uniref:DnaD domain protein n=1 Tax=unclassified Mycoplasma TaxID=2683645 RepID=UPI00216B6440|nr:MULTISPECIES: DnaD domain protein [unclassified Mycoplasma]MCS4536708.1 DnaD domain protein [Mycoplasma sp. CSL7475-4]MCT4469805.1 DnaD domain protein [Mycoplasma sp. HS2188]
MKKDIYPYFIAESPSIIGGEDLKNLRKFYAPILGANAIVLYEYLRDLAIEKNNSEGFHDYDNITYMLKMDLKELNEARFLLESVSLISTYIDELKRKTLFIVEKPLDSKGLKQNIFLANKLVKIIGFDNYNRIIGKENKSILRVEYLEDASTRFDEMFDIDTLDLNLNKDQDDEQQKRPDTTANDIQVKLDLNNFNYSNVYEAILKTSSVSFFSQIQGQIPTKNIIDLINEANKIGFDDQCVNLIFYYANEMNGYINYNYVRKIIKDLANKNIIYFEPLEIYIDTLIREKKKMLVTKKDLFKASYIESLNEGEKVYNG